MATILEMPKLGYSMTEGKILEWIKGEGEPVIAGEAILTIETDKVNYDIEAPDSGILAKILVRPEEIVPVGTAMAMIVHPGESIPEALAKES